MKGECGLFRVSPPVCHSVTSVLRGPRFCEESSAAEKGPSMLSTGSPVLLHAWKHHRKRRSVRKLPLNILKGRIIRAKKAGKMRDSPSIERVLREMERGVNSTTHIVYGAALIKIPSCSRGGDTVTGFRRLSKTAGVYLSGGSRG